MHIQVAIVGAGLTGLSIARALHRAGISCHVFEARDRLGGRIRTEALGDDWFDLGPSWFWPGQPRMTALVQALGLDVFEQYADGALLCEAETGEVVRDRGFSSMQGSLRVKGGMGAIVAGIARGLPVGAISLGRRVMSIGPDGALVFESGEPVSADLVIVALPPRVAAALSFEPALSSEVVAAFESIPTWMAGHAKFVAVYDQPFWRAEGLSGDAMSRLGPMVEIHDASSDNRGALFGFLGVPAQARAGRSADVKAVCVAQLQRLFGEKASQPEAIFYADWATEPETAMPRDAAPLMHHPAYGRPDALRPTDSPVFFASTELASDMGGFLEGALSAAEDAVDWAMSRL